MAVTKNDPRDKSRSRVVGLHFEPAEGGLLSRTHLRTSHSGKGGGPLEEASEGGPIIHKSLGHAKKHLEAVFAAHLAAKRKAADQQEAEEQGDEDDE